MMEATNTSPGGAGYMTTGVNRLPIPGTPPGGPSRRFSVPATMAGSRLSAGPETEQTKSFENARLEHLRMKHHLKESKSGGLSGDRQKIFNALEERGNGSMLRGWRRELDPEGMLEIGFQDFCKCMANLGVQVDTGRLFSLDGVPDRVTIEDLAPVQAALINRFRDWVKANFDDPLAMFEAFAAGQGMINRESFVSGCKERRFKTTELELEELYRCLDYDETDSVTKDEVMFLEADTDIRAQTLFRLKMKSRSQRQRLLAYVYRDDGQRADSNKHRRAQRPWMAETFEKLPAIICEKRISQQQVFYKNCILARQAFVDHVRARYGNEVRAWRRGLDSDCNFRVKKADLRQYCRQHDLNIDFTCLWRALDRDCDEFFTLEELGVRPAQVLASFRLWAHSCFGACAAIWDLPDIAEVRCKPHLQGRWVSDKKMLVGPFGRCLKTLGWEDDAALSVLTQALDLYGCGFVSLPDLWWLDAWDPPAWLSHPPDPAALVEFLALVNSEYEAPLKAWRKLMDADSDNMVSWVEFSNACRKVKFRGNAGGAWRCLDQECSGTISLKEWDPKGAELLVSFKNWAEANFGSIELAFKAFDKNGSGSLTLADLKRACRRLKWQGDVRMLFNCLGLGENKDKGQSRNTLVLADVVFLDSWIDPGLLATGLTQATAAKEKNKKEAEPEEEDTEMLVDRHNSLTAYMSGPRKKASSSRPSLYLEDQGAAAAGSGPSSPQAEALPRSQHDRLHRMYHVVGASARNRVPPKQQKPKERALQKAQNAQKAPIKKSKSLPWLQRINELDGLSTA